MVGSVAFRTVIRQQMVGASGRGRPFTLCWGSRERDRERDREKEEEEEDRGERERPRSHVLFKGTSSGTRTPPARPHLLKFHHFPIAPS